MHWTIRQKLVVSFAGVLLISLLSSLFFCTQLDRLARVENDFLANQMPAIIADYDLRSANNRANAALTRLLLLRARGLPADEAKADLAETLVRMDENAAVLLKLSKRFTNARNQALAEETVVAVTTYKRVQEEIKQGADNSSLDQSIALLTNKSNAATITLRNVSRELASGIQNVIGQQSALIQKGKDRTKQLLILGTIISIVMGLGIAFLISGKIARALAAVVARATAIAAGDLTGQPLVAQSRDEVADLTTAINQMQSHLNSVIRSIEQNSEGVASASEEIASAAMQSAQGSTAQSGQTTQVATAMQEMSASLLEVSGNTSRAADASRKAVATAMQGGKIVEEALLTMRSLAESVDQTAGKIEALGKNSDQIGKIVAVIEEIADQTNLLALNAAIEAARAGEQGRGFAVVADEVRKLAERTAKATKEIAQMIETVQMETKTAVTQMQAETKKVEAGVTTTAKAGSSLDEIIAQVQQVGDMIALIAAASTQQTTTAEQINSNVGQIAKIAQESADGAQQSAKACQDLSDLALDLQQLVSRFKLDATSGSARAGSVAGAHGNAAARTPLFSPQSGLNRQTRAVAQSVA